jgi:undecaprenyl pyrophosphate phosphatase UppP
MIVSMISGGIFRVSWLLQTVERHPFRIFSMHII